jgi:hypothetical protein
MTGSWNRKTAEFGSVPGLAIALGLVADVSFIRKFGANRSVDTGSVPESIWSGGGLYPWPAAAVALEVLSASTADDAATGQGAWTIEVQGLDANWEMQRATVTLDGQLVVAIPGSWIRVFRARIVTAGTVHVNSGIITIRVASGGTNLALIDAGLGQTTMAIYTIPAGHTGYITQIRSSVVRDSPSVTIVAAMAFFIRDNAVANAAWNMRLEQVAGQFVSTAVPGVITEKTDIDARVTYVSASSAQVVAEFEIVLVKESD